MLKVTELFLFETCIKVMKNGDKDVDLQRRISKSSRDNYVPEENNIYVIYGRNARIDKELYGSISDTILDVINFERGNKGVEEHEKYFLINNVRYLKKDIPPIDIERCLDIKAENNRVVFTHGQYYRFMDSDGKYRALTCVHDHFGQPNSEMIRGNANDISYRAGQFWNLLSWNGTNIGLYYSHEEQRKILNDAGITEGFFSIQVGSEKQDYFYSNGTAGTLIMKGYYDRKYHNMYTGAYDWWWLSEYEPGSVFTIGGKEYILSADKTLDVPYGEDIFDVKYPPRMHQ